MARQRIHNRRAGRGSSGTGASWISYSDMMAALLLIFVLILTYSLYQYFTMLETKTKELNDQQIVLDQQAIDLRLARDELDEKEATLIIIQGNLDDLKVKLEEQEKSLADLKIVLSAREADLEAATLKLQEQNAEISAERKSQVGSGDRSERIRTYNFPQGRVTDHRIGMTIYKLDNFLDGDIDEIVDGLITSDQAEKMKNL